MKKRQDLALEIVSLKIIELIKDIKMFFKMTRLQSLFLLFLAISKILIKELEDDRKS